MTGDQAKQLLRWYGAQLREHKRGSNLIGVAYAPLSANYLPGFCDRAQELDAVIQEKKLMRWLGYAQGITQAEGIFNLDDLLRHSEHASLGKVPAPEENLGGC